MANGFMAFRMLSEDEPLTSALAECTRDVKHDIRLCDPLDMFDGEAHGFGENDDDVIAGFPLEQEKQIDEHGVSHYNWEYDSSSITANAFGLSSPVPVHRKSEEYGDHLFADDCLLQDRSPPEKGARVESIAEPALFEVDLSNLKQPMSSGSIPEITTGDNGNCFGTNADLDIIGLLSQMCSAGGVSSIEASRPLQDLCNSFLCAPATEDETSPNRGGSGVGPQGNREVDIEEACSSALNNSDAELLLGVVPPCESKQNPPRADVGLKGTFLRRESRPSLANAKSAADKRKHRMERRTPLGSSNGGGIRKNKLPQLAGVDAVWGVMSQEHHNLSEEERQKLIKRLRNRDSVERCRAKQKKRLEALEWELSALRQENKTLLAVTKCVRGTFEAIANEVASLTGQRPTMSY